MLYVFKQLRKTLNAVMRNYVFTHKESNTMKKQKNRASIISLIGTKGGGGKTTKTIHLGVAFSEGGYKTLLIDTDIKGSTMAWENRREYDNSNLKVIALPESSSLASTIDKYSSVYDVIVIDGTPRPNEDIITVSITVADLVLIPIQPTSLDLWKVLESLIEQINVDLPIIKEKTGRKPNIYFSVSRLKPSQNRKIEIYETLKNTFGYPVIKSFYGDRVAYFDSLGSGVTLLQWDDKKAKEEVLTHFGEVKKILKI